MTTKMVLLVRTDLDMSKGKMIAQCGHAVHLCIEHIIRNSPDDESYHQWRDDGMTKIVLAVRDGEDMFKLTRDADAIGLRCGIVWDEGRTEVEPNTPTVAFIGPNASSEIDRITRELPLL